MIKKIEPCPIIEATIQINCSFTVDQDAVVGIMYSLLNDLNLGKPELQRLSILNLPREIRNSDPNLRDKPWYQIKCGDYIVLVGLFGFAIGITGEYKGWAAFKDFAVKVFDIVKPKIVESINSVSLKYLNFFKGDNIFENVNCDFILNGKKVTQVPTIFRTETKEDDFVKMLQITNGVHLINKALNIDDDGSLIELNLFTRNVIAKDYKDIIEEAHLREKQTFFDLISEDYLSKFKVEQDE
jgi:uncharacterized protein (TIGR04255 family)